jgi:hypothetical protein
MCRASAGPSGGFLLVLRGLPWILWLPVFVPTVNPASPNTRTMTHNIHVTQFVEPKILHCVGCCRQIAFAELLVSLCGSDIEFVQDPLLDETLVACRLSPEQYVREYVVDSEQKQTSWVGLGLKDLSSFNIANLVTL